MGQFIETGADHDSSLNGLSGGDGHTQYALLAGRSGGQTLIGGTGSGENLNLRSTSHATKGKVRFGSSATTVYDEVNERLGVNASSPGVALDVGGTIRSITPDSTTSPKTQLAQTGAVAWENYLTTTTGNWAVGIEGGQTAITAQRSGTSVVGVGIGNGATSPAHMLDVVQDSASAYAARVFHDGDNANRQGLIIQCGEDTPASATSASFINLLEGDGAQTGLVSANAAGVVSYSDVSDSGRKTDIAPTQIDGLAVCMAIPLVEYRRRKDVPSPVLGPDGRPLGQPQEFKYAKNPIGWIAQDCLAAFPSMVTDAGGLLMTDRSMLVPVLVRAIQQQQAAIASLTSRIAALERLPAAGAAR